MKWNPYPKKQPPKRVKNYLVTYRTESRHLVVGTSTYFKGEEIRDYEGNVVEKEGWEFSCFDRVVAWAELPEPYHPRK